jgi:hypothetical protein
VSFNGKPTHPLTLPVYRGILPRLVGKTRATWSAGFALWGSATPKSLESPERKQRGRRSR